MNKNYDIASFNSINNSAKPKWIINGKSNNKFDSDDMQFNIEYDMTAYEYCPYCTCKLLCRDFAEYIKDDDCIAENLEELQENGEYPTKLYCLKVCPNCSYWKFSGYQEKKFERNKYFMMCAISVSQKFTTTLPTGCSSELAQQLRRNSNLWHTLAPRRMETFVADIFRSNHKHCDVIHVGRPGDLGVDVLFIDDNATKWLIQVKRREKPNKAEGFSTLQSILGTLALHGEQHGIIVSTADYFSAQAKKQAINAAARGYKVELIDKGLLSRMIENLLPNKPWLSVFSHPDVHNFIGSLENDFAHFDKRTDQHVHKITERADVSTIDPNQLKLFSS